MQHTVGLKKVSEEILVTGSSGLSQIGCSI